MLRSIASIALFTLSFAACGPGASALTNLTPQVREVVSIERQRGEGPFVANGVESLVVIYDAPTLRAPEWSISAGALRAQGDQATWQLPEAGPAEVTVTLFLVDGREVSSTWSAQIVSAPAGEALSD
ncbi:MAG: hypothetical protein JNG84_04625 [Archangium sp.]|nr:hypothetical protein [Archangium sp.]